MSVRKIVSIINLGWFLMSKLYASVPFFLGFSSRLPLLLVLLFVLDFLVVPGK